MAKDLSKPKPPEIPAKKPEIIPPVPEKRYDQYQLAQLNITAASNNNLNLTAQWRFCKNTGSNVELGQSTRILVINNILDPDVQQQYPDIITLLSVITEPLANICQTGGIIDI